MTPGMNPKRTPFEDFKKFFVELKNIHLQKKGISTEQTDAIVTPIELKGNYITVSIDEALARKLGEEAGGRGEMKVFGLRWYPAALVGYPEESGSPKRYIKKLDHRDSLIELKMEMLSQINESAGATLDGVKEKYMNLLGYKDGVKAYGRLLEEHKRKKHEISPPGL